MKAIINHATSSYSASTQDSLDKVEENLELKTHNPPTLNLPLIFLYEKDYIIEKICHSLQNSITDTGENIIEDTGETSKNCNNQTTEEEINELFNVKELPNLNLQEYLTRVDYFLDLEISTILIGAIFLERIFNTGFVLNEYNKYKLIITAITLAVKMNDDDVPAYDYLAKVGGVKVEELKNLELNYCDKLAFSLFVEECEFERFYLDLISS